MINICQHCHLEKQFKYAENNIVLKLDDLYIENF